MECVGTWCKHQDGLLKEQRETICSLEADRDEVSPVEPCEGKGMADVNGYTRSLGGMEAPGLLVVARIPEVIVPECVVKCESGTGEYGTSVMACESACEELKCGRIQTGDMNGEPGGPKRVNLTTAPGSRDGSYGVRGALRARPARARLRDCDPA